MPGFLQSRSSDWNCYSRMIPGTLWPNETAWRLKLDFKSTAGIAPEDQVTFRNVPLLKSGAARSIRRTQTRGPIQCVLEESMSWDSQGVASPQFHVEIRSAPDDMAADVVRVTAGTGAQVSTFRLAWMRSGSAKNSIAWFSILYPPPTNVTAVDITCVLQKTRTVEFMVKPPKTQ